MERQTITVDIAPGNSQVERLGSSQGDIGRPMGVYIIQNGVALDCSAYSAELYIIKPDGKFYTTQATVDATEKNLIKWETALQETPVAGACAAQIRIAAGDDDIGTARFVEFVEASPGDMGSASESEVALLTEYVRQARESATSAGRDATTASGAASSASGSASTASAAASTATQAASTATAAAERAEEIEESIPEDYSQLSDDVTGLKSAIGSIDSRFDNPNVMSGLLDKTGLVVGSGQVLTGTPDMHCVQFKVSPETQYRIVMPIANRSGFTGNNTGVFEVGQTYTAFSASVTYTNSYVFTTPANVTYVLLYFYGGSYTFDPDDFQLYLGDSIPSDLNVKLKQTSLPNIPKANLPAIEVSDLPTIPYSKLGDIPYNKITNVEVEKEQTAFIKLHEGINKFNKNDSDVTPQRMIDANGNIVTLSSQSYIISGFVPVEANTSYAIYCGSGDAGQYGGNAYYTAIMYDAGKTKIGKVTGTANTGYYTLTTSADAAYMRVNIYNSLDVFMVVKGTTYPAAYTPFSDYYYLEGVQSGDSGGDVNPLYGKTILWNGDSICAGKAFNDTGDAWAGRIAANNSMTYKNYAVGGGTITENVQQGGVTKHSVCATLATMYQEFPNADYIVFDGGCNDADLLGNMITGTPERLGTFSMSDFSGNYDEDTFCGAFESILYRMTNYWRNAKFAYIIPHKMGILNEYRTDYTKEHHNYRAYYNLAIQMCEKWGVRYLDLWDGCFFCPMISHMCDTYGTMTQQEIYDAGFVYADRQHLTQRGYDLEALMIENWLKTI